MYAKNDCVMDIKSIEIAQFNYPLPDEQIARHPLELRDQCKLLVRRHNGDLEEHVFAELPQLLPEESMLVYNNTRVINARLHFRKLGGGAVIEIFCLEPDSPRDYQQSFASTNECTWMCFVGNSKRWKEGRLAMDIVVDGLSVELSAERIEKVGNGSIVKFSWTCGVTFSQIIEAAGEIPIPPYLDRPTEQSDSVDYQTVFSRVEGSVAAPTAGLHFTSAVLDEIDDRAIPRLEVTLHVGAGTFQPVKSDTIGEHSMHSEFISVDKSVIDALARGDRRVIAVGTTSVRTLESLYHLGCMAYLGMSLFEVPQWFPYSSEHPHLSSPQALTALSYYMEQNHLDRLISSTRIIIAPGYEYKVVKGMVTNFHQPQSTLLLLVSAFTAGDWRRMYDYALSHNFRFLSYGDAQLLL